MITTAIGHWQRYRTFKCVVSAFKREILKEGERKREKGGSKEEAEEKRKIGDGGRLE